VIEESGCNEYNLVRVPTTTTSCTSHSSIAPMRTTLEMPIALVTVNKLTFKTKSRMVADNGSGLLVDMDVEDRGIMCHDNDNLTVGSHAFVRCSGEPHLRCTLESYEFGFAKQHAMLAGGAHIMMAGEIEVNAEGVLTRWLNKSESYSAPKHIIGQAGLPFDLAWLYMSNSDVMAMEKGKRQMLEVSGCLRQLNTKGTASTTNSIDSLGVQSQHEHSWVMKAYEEDGSPLINQGVGNGNGVDYLEAKERMARFHSMLKRAMTLQEKTSRVKPMTDGELITMAASSVGVGNTTTTTTTTTEDLSSLVVKQKKKAYFKDKRMIFDMEEDEEVERNKVISSVNEMKRQMLEAGVFEVHRKVSNERRLRKVELGFSTNTNLG
jgi:hypothetical protein